MANLYVVTFEDTCIGGIAFKEILTLKEAKLVEERNNGICAAKFEFFARNV